MKDGELALVIVALTGLLGGNQLLAFAAAALLAVTLVAPPPVIEFLEQYSIQAGILFMTLGLLVPFATGQVGLSSIIRTLLTPAGVVAIVVGAIASYLGLGGLNLLTAKPQVMVGLVAGSILGVYLFGGIPTGPLVAAGFTALLFRLLRVGG